MKHRPSEIFGVVDAGRELVWVYKAQTMNTAHSSYQDNDEFILILTNGDSKHWRVSKLISDTVIQKIKIQTDFRQFQYIVLGSPIDETIAALIFGIIAIAISARLFSYFDVLERTLRGSYYTFN